MVSHWRSIVCLQRTCIVPDFFYQSLPKCSDGEEGDRKDHTAQRGPGLDRGIRPKIVSRDLSRAPTFE
jgi:hypothetical protein